MQRSDMRGQHTNRTSPMMTSVRFMSEEKKAPFSVIPNAKIPDLTEFKTVERDERKQSLNRKPKHKFRDYGAANQQDKLLNAPLTM